jgi:SAM-dependent methyltransferase
MTLNAVKFVKSLSAAVAVALIVPAWAVAQQPQTRPFEPTVGQAGKDVVWVPTPEVLVEKMLDMAKVTPQDVVVDLGSGDGRNIIAAAKRGARSRGVEFNPDMVELSRRRATEAGVGERAQFVQGDMFAADFSDATVLALFLLPVNLDQLKPKFAALKPGTRIVVNTFGIDGWDPESTEKIEGDCSSWCTAMLYIVPAQVAGTWKLPQGELMLNQDVQRVTGTLTSGGKSIAISGKITGDQISFTAGATQFTGKVNGSRIDGMSVAGNSKQAFTATRGN